MEINQSRKRVLLLAILAAILLLSVISIQQLATVVAAEQQQITLLPQYANEAEVAAQATALADSRVSDLLVGQRSEVFIVKEVRGDHYPASAIECATATCSQVEIYLWDLNDTISAIVNMDSGQVVDTIYYENMQPAINNRVYELSVELIQNDPDIQSTLGFVPRRENMQPMMASLDDEGKCNVSHYCVGYVFAVDSGNVAVVVDATEEKVARVWWNERSENPDTLDYDQTRNVPTNCSGSVSLSQNGWTMDYVTTPTDALRISNVKFNGVDVATSVKLVEWHARYSGSWGYEDFTGCQTFDGGNGFPINPSGDAYTQTLGTAFELIQNFEMSNWGASCNYRYEQRYQFWPDGSWRVVTGAFGEGCGNDREAEAIYRPLVRIDIAVDGDANDSFQTYDGNGWTIEANEGAWWQDTGSADSSGNFWRVFDSNGSGYYIEPGQGQFRDGGTGDSGWIYAVKHSASEGDADMPLIGEHNPADDSPEHGPHNYIDNESISTENIVLWYVPQSQTITTWQVENTAATAQYCWTDGVNPGEYWPCYSGPKFKPFTLPPTAVEMQATATNNGAIASTTLIISLMAVIGMTFVLLAIVRRNDNV